MNDAIRHLDQRLKNLRALAEISRPPKGWARAIRDALGMTTAQLGKRLGVSQPRIVEIEQTEVSGTITLNSLQRAAEALGCRFVYAFIPEKPLAETVKSRAEHVAKRQLSAIQQTMRLENQSVTDKAATDRLREKMVADLLRRPARLWDQK